MSLRNRVKASFPLFWSTQSIVDDEMFIFVSTSCKDDESKTRQLKEMHLSWLGKVGSFKGLCRNSSCNVFLFEKQAVKVFSFFTDIGVTCKAVTQKYSQEEHLRVLFCLKLQLIWFLKSTEEFHQIQIEFFLFRSSIVGFLYTATPLQSSNTTSLCENKKTKKKGKHCIANREDPLCILQESSSIAKVSNHFSVPLHRQNRMFGIGDRIAAPVHLTKQKKRRREKNAGSSSYSHIPLCEQCVGHIFQWKWQHDLHLWLDLRGEHQSTGFLREFSHCCCSAGTRNQSLLCELNELF